ncbi:MAG: hypothetical protein ACTTJC_01990 [Campylobacter sp.]
MFKFCFKKTKNSGKNAQKASYIQGENARFWSKFFYKNRDGFVVCKVNGAVADKVANYDKE